MRRLILISVCCMTLTAFSQDIITTVSGETIKAKITEVTDETVSYKKHHDQEGATFIIKKEKITKIAWENGDVDEYNREVATEQNNVSSNPPANLPFITKGMRLFYLSNGQVYDETELKSFLMEQHLGSVWNQYLSGKRSLGMGCSLAGVGVIFGSIGFISFKDGEFPAFWVISGALVVIGVPLAISGGIKQKAAINDYNSIYGGKPRPQYSQNVTYKIGLVGNGLGFSLNF